MIAPQGYMYFGERNSKDFHLFVYLRDTAQMQESTQGGGAEAERGNLERTPRWPWSPTQGSPRPRDHDPSWKSRVRYQPGAPGEGNFKAPVAALEVLSVLSGRQVPNQVQGQRQCFWPGGFCVDSSLKIRSLILFEGKWFSWKEVSWKLWWASAILENRAY